VADRTAAAYSSYMNTNANLTYQMRHFSEDHGYMEWKDMKPFAGTPLDGSSLHKSIDRAFAKGKTVTAKNKFGGGIEYRAIVK